MKNKITPKLRAVVSPLVIAWALSGVAQAQNTTPATQVTDAQPSTSLDDIVVTARKVAENLQDVPVSITAFSGEDLVAQNVQRIQDIQKFTPGLAFRQSSGSAAAVAITLRGQVQSDNLATLDPSVGTYVDGVYWARAYGLNGDLLDISSVQVLKGPQGTLFGRNTTGGALLITTNDPNPSSISGSGTVQYGRFNEFQGTAVLNLPLITDKLAIRLAAQLSRRDPYTTNVGTGVSAVPASAPVSQHYVGSQLGKKYDNKDRLSLRGKLLFKATDNLSLLLSADYYDLDETSPTRIFTLALPTYTAANTTYSTGSLGALGAGGAGGVSAGLRVLAAEAAFDAANPNATKINETPYVTAKTYTYNGTLSLDTFFGNMKLIGGFRKIKSFNGFDNDGSATPVLYTEGAQDLKQKSLELQITGKAFDNALDFAAGAFVFHESGSDRTLSVTLPTVSAVTSHNLGIIDNDSIGVYAQGTFHFTDAFSFTGGLRYSADDKGLDALNNTYNRNTGITTCLLVPGVTFNAGGEVIGPQQCRVTRRDSFEGVSYTAGLEFKPTEDILLYVKTAKGFRSGGENLRAPTLAFLIPFKPETAYSYEIGAKAEFFDRRLRFNVAAYTSDINNIQRTTLIAAPTGTGTATILGNAGKARIRGVEVEVQAVVARGLRLSASGALTDPKYVKFADLSGDRSFERFVNVPKKQFSVAADYTTDVSFGKLSGRVDYAWIGKMPLESYFYAPNPLNQAIVDASTKPAFGVMGARVSADIGDNFNLAVFGRNLTNRRDLTSALIVAPLGVVSGIRQEPRTYGVSGTVRF